MCIINLNDLNIELVFSSSEVNQNEYKDEGHIRDENGFIVIVKEYGDDYHKHKNR